MQTITAFFKHYPELARFLTLGVGCSMLTALILLPAVLHLRTPREAPDVRPIEILPESRLAA